MSASTYEQVYNTIDYNCYIQYDCLYSIHGSVLLDVFTVLQWQLTGFKLIYKYKVPVVVGDGSVCVLLFCVWG